MNHLRFSSRFNEDYWRKNNCSFIGPNILREDVKENCNVSFRSRGIETLQDGICTFGISVKSLYRNNLRLALSRKFGKTVHVSFDIKRKTVYDQSVLAEQAGIATIDELDYFWIAVDVGSGDLPVYCYALVEGDIPGETVFDAIGIDAFKFFNAIVVEGVGLSEYREVDPFIIQGPIAPLDKHAKNIYLYDDSPSWDESQLPIFMEKYADSGVTDIVRLIYHGPGLMGWASTVAISDPKYKNDFLEKYIHAARSNGINVHAMVNTCRSGNATVAFPEKDGFVDVFNEAFQKWIVKIYVDALIQYPFTGINIDFIRTENDPPEGRRNEEAVTNIVRSISKTVRNLFPKVLISTSTLSYSDYRSSFAMGRAAIKWINDNLVDVNFDMTYGDPIGHPPDLAKVIQARSLVKYPEKMAMSGSSYEREEDDPAKPIPNTQFGRVLNIMAQDVNENRVIYTNWLLNDENLEIMREYYVGKLS